MKALVRDGYWGLTTEYVHYNYSNISDGMYIRGLEYDLLKVVYEQMNMSFVHVPRPEGFELEVGSVNNLIPDLVEIRLI